MLEDSVREAARKKDWLSVTFAGWKSCDSDETTLPICDSTREFLTVELARKLGLDDRAERIAGMLIKRAETINPLVSVISLAQRFETKQLWDDAERTYLYLIKKFPAEKGRTYDRLTHCYRHQGDSAALLAS